MLNFIRDRAIYIDQIF